MRIAGQAGRHAPLVNEKRLAGDFLACRRLMGGLARGFYGLLRSTPTVVTDFFGVFLADVFFATAFFTGVSMTEVSSSAGVFFATVFFTAFFAGAGLGAGVAAVFFAGVFLVAMGNEC